jgi:CDGSH-type Zn-finger protein
MTDVVVAQKSPFTFEAEANTKYWWCACGRSAKQPFCDGSHKGTGFTPQMFIAEKSETVWMCGCKHTRRPPFCDGTHESL